MEKKILCAFFLLIFTNTFSQEFSSNLEEQIFSNYKKDSVNYPFIKSLFVIDSTFSEDKLDGYLNEINSLLTTFKPKQERERKEKKRIKKIYNAYHKKFLKKYDIEAFFPDIFKNGHYNCVTATALYAYVFDKLNIPYKVKEAPSHVYLIAYPETYKIHLETTAPGSYGFLAPKDSEIKKIVNELITLKLVTEKEVSEKGYKEIYEDYFYGKEFIKKSALIGMQYYNKAVFSYQNEDYKSAENNFSKSFTFYNSPLGKILYISLLQVNLGNLKFTTLKDVDKLVNTLSKLEYKKDFNDIDIKRFSYEIIDSDNSDDDFISKSCEKLSTLKNKDVRTIFEETIYSYLAKDESNKLNFDNALTYSKKLLEINTKNKVAKEIIIFSVSKKMAVSSYDDKSLKEFEDFYNTYKFLENDKRIETLRAIFYGELTIKELKNKNIENALNQLEKLEGILENKKELLMVNPKFYPYIYLNMGRHFYGRNKFKKAKEMFKKGLKYAPDNPDLKKMYKWAKEDSN